MKTLLCTFALAASLLAQDSPARKLRVVTTLTVLGDIAKHVGGDLVEVRSLGRPTADPHYIIATPSLMTIVNRADLFVEVGLSLEIWAENVLDGARNAKIRRGERGHVFASAGVVRKEVPANLSRAAGDLHPEGNPHIWLDPVNVRRIATNIRDGLVRVAPDHEKQFDKNLAAYLKKIDEDLYGKKLVAMLGGDVLGRLAEGGRLMKFLEAKSFRGKKLVSYLGGWLAKARPLRGKKIIFYHPSWIYLTDLVGLVVVDHVEDKPGINPSAAHKEHLVDLIRAQKVPVIALTNYYDDTVPNALAKATGAKVVVLPGNVRAAPGAGDYEKLMDTILDRLLAAYAEN